MKSILIRSLTAAALMLEVVFCASCGADENAAVKKIIAEMPDDEIYRRICAASEYSYLFGKYENVTARTKATAAGQEVTSFRTADRSIVDYNRTFTRTVHENGEGYGYWYDIELPYQYLYTDEKQYDGDISSSIFIYSDKDAIVSKSAANGKLIVTVLSYIPEDEMVMYCTAHEILYSGDGRVYATYTVNPENFETETVYYKYMAINNEMIFKKTDIEYDRTEMSDADDIYNDVKGRVFNGNKHRVSVILSPCTKKEKRIDKEIGEGVFAYIRTPDDYKGAFYSDPRCSEILNVMSVENQFSLGDFTTYLK